MRIILTTLVLAFSAVTANAQESSRKSKPPERSSDAGRARIEVTLASDSQTWVSITNVLVPDKFSTASVRLAPGDYEVIGRRRGYQDVRKTLQVRSEPPKTSYIACTVPER